MIQMRSDELSILERARAIVDTLPEKGLNGRPLKAYDVARIVHAALLTNTCYVADGTHRGVEHSWIQFRGRRKILDVCAMYREPRVQLIATIDGDGYKESV